MTGTTAFNGTGGLDVFAKASPADLSDADTTGRTHSERHDDPEAAMEAVQAFVTPPVTFSSPGTASVPFTVAGTAAQVANLTEWENSGGTAVAYVSPTGGMQLVGLKLGTNQAAPDFGTTGHADNSMSPIDFWWDEEHRRLHTRTILLTENSDPAELAIRRSGDGDWDDAPTAVTDAMNIGLIHWTGWAAGVDEFNTRQAQIYVRAKGDLDGTNHGGEMFFGVNPINTAGNPPDTLILRSTGQVEIARQNGKTTLSLTDTTANVGITIGADTNLYRSAANTLATDDDLAVGGMITSGITRVLSSSYLPGTSGVYWSGGTAAASVTGSIDIVALVRATNFTPAGQQCIVSRWLPSGNQRSWRAEIEQTSGKLSLIATADGTTTVISGQSTVTTGFTNDTWHWVRWTRNSTSGDMAFYTAAYRYAVPTSWTQLGTTIAGGGIGAPTGSMFGGSATLDHGAITGGTNNLFAGNIAYCEIRNGIGGTPASVLDLRNGIAARHRDVYGNTHTINGATWAMQTETVTT